MYIITFLARERQMLNNNVIIRSKYKSNLFIPCKLYFGLLKIFLNKLSYYAIITNKVLLYRIRIV